MEEFPFLERAKSEAGLKINGIRKMHQLSLDMEGIREKKLSCMSCDVSSLCLTCKEQKLKFKSEKIKNVLGTVVREAERDSNDQAESDEEAPMQGVETSDGVEAGDNVDNVEEVDQDQEDQKDVGLGDIVWVLFNRRWVAGKIVSLGDIPNSSLSWQLKSFSDSTSLVKFYHNSSFHKAANSKIEQLAQNLVDQSRARHQPTAYMEALSDLSYG